MIPIARPRASIEFKPMLPGIWDGLKKTFHFWMETETHVYAFSVAANVLLSFYPFLFVILALSRMLLGTNLAIQSVELALNDYFPGQLEASLEKSLIMGTRGHLEYLSIGVLLFTANGVFEPLEVALNRIFGIATNRSFVKNQIVSLILIFTCGALTMISTLLTAANRHILEQALGSAAVVSFLAVAFFKVAAVPITCLTLFLIYTRLPNGRVPFDRAVPAAIGVGLLFELLKYVNFLTWPWFNVKLAHEYGPFAYAVAIVMWSFLGSMILLGGAEWASRTMRIRETLESHP
jgi:membrane protein